MKTTTIPTLMLLAAVLAQTAMPAQAQQDASPARPLTRADVTAELIRAREAGELDWVLIEVLRPQPAAKAVAKARPDAASAPLAAARAEPERR